MNTGVPRTGLGMVEVTSPATNPPILKVDPDSLLTVADDDSWGQQDGFRFH